jgi:small-conductance mechanosensitive channel
MAEFHLRHGWFFVIFLFCAALVLANAIHYVVFRVLRRNAAAGPSTGWGLQQHLGRPARAIFLLSCLLVALPFVPGLPDRPAELIRQGILMLIICALGWFVVGCIYAAQAVALRKYDLATENSVQARRVHTQFQLFRRMAIGFVVIVTIGALLWSFNDPRIWKYGSGLLASAGVASLILAAAAKSTASNFLAGLQIALTEPIRIDDVVLVQGEWGKIEEITTSYVVVRIWDLRRLIVPLSFFIENSFQNWTRESSDIVGTAFLYVDYTIPVPELRAQLMELAAQSPLWDGKVCSLQVTNLTDRSMELRCVVSSRNIGENFDLRCLVREQMTEWIREHYPTAFPATRIAAVSEMDGDAAGPLAGMQHGSERPATAISSSR